MDRLWNRQRYHSRFNTYARARAHPQAQTSCLFTHLQPFTSDFPRANIYEMISPDLLHQIIKGAFKDHLVRWVCEYLVAEHGERKANDILDDIDRR